MTPLGQSCITEDCSRADRVGSDGRPMSLGKDRAKHPGNAAGYGSKLLSKDCRDNVGKVRSAAGADSNLHGPVAQGLQTEATGGQRTGA